MQGLLGCLGARWGGLRRWGDWDLEILNYLIWPFLLNKVGVFFNNQTRWWQRFLKKSTIRMVLFWSLVWVGSHHMHGTVFAMLKLFSKQGLVWRVGDGASIKIWTDRWLPTPGSHKVHSPMTVLSAEARVSALLDMETNWWRTGLIHSIFGIEEAEAICSMASVSKI
jgi:hypothetical protein